MSEAQIDLEWDDDHVMPEVVNPEVDFLFTRMTAVTYEKVNPRPGERILDVGCGRANDGVELAAKCALVVGLEPSHVMTTHAREYVARNEATNVAIVHGVGEYLPFAPGTFDKVVCKGALDHFADPSVAINQMGKMLKPNGEVIIAIANFESLGFKIGRGICLMMKWLRIGDVQGRMTWDIPEDHTYRFQYSNLKQMAGQHLNVKQMTGVSLLFGVPWWGSFLARLPRRVSSAILNSLDRIARVLPSASDVIVLRATLKKGS